MTTNSGRPIAAPGPIDNGALSIVAYAPNVGSLPSSLSSMGSGGGHVTLSATVSSALTCDFVASRAVSGLRDAPFSSEEVSDVVTVPANTSTKRITYQFTLVASGATAVKSTSVTVQEAAR